MRMLLASLIFSISAQAQFSDKQISEPQVLEFVKQNPGRFGLKSSDLSEAVVSDFYKDSRTGITHAYIQQVWVAKPIFNSIISVHFNSFGELAATNSNMVSMSNFKQIGISDNFDFHVALNAANSETQTEFAFSDFKLINPLIKNLYTESGRYYYPCWFVDGYSLIACVNFIYFDPGTGDWWNVLVSSDGNILFKISWTQHCNLSANATQKSMGAGDSAHFNAFRFTVESPLYGSRSFMVNPHDSLASPFGWLDVNGLPGPEYTTTRGNNVRSTEDRDANNQPGYSPNASSSLIFDFNFDSTETDPLNYQDFAITNLFVANNLLHDILYHYGFDEKSGNFQLNNYGRGGMGNDEVNADAQDGSGTNNANFSTPPDGNNPRMQMFIWDATAGNGATLKVNSPTKDKITVGKAQFGAPLTTTPITADLVYVNDGVGSGKKGCKSLKNATALNGKIAAIERGDCLFVEKVLFAQQAGAIAAVVLDTSVQDVLISMSGTNSQVTIPSVFVKYSDAGNFQELLLGGAVNISLYDSSGVQPKTDSDLDLGVIAHEYGHGVSNRLTCGPSNTSSLGNAEQMGEGWSDFLGLAFTVKPGDVGTTKRGIGNWLIGEGKNGLGIRTYPYSTNMAVNPHTYNNVKLKAVAGKTETHYLGEVWCAMLWDLHWKMVEKYGFSNDLYYGKLGNNMSIELVIEAMKLQKCNPGFVDGRNAILKADSLLNGGANAKLIWEVFARRGLGFSANQGSSFSTSDGTEAFDLPLIYSNSINPIETQFVSVYPNPANKVLNIEASSVMHIDAFRFCDGVGREIGVRVIEKSSQMYKLNIANLKPGIYYLTVMAEGKQHVYKVQKGTE